MRRICRTLGSVAFLSLIVVGCGPVHWDPVNEAPPKTDPPEAPDDPPPTGQIYDEVVYDGDCGHQTIGWVLVDEMCGALDAKDYLARFRAPMFRDGVAIGAFLYTVDGTNLWVLDVSNPESVPRQALTSGLGTPVSMGAHAGNLVIAAGGEGLLLVDVTDPGAPARLATVALDGPALDVHVEGDRAFVAMGAAGMAVVDLLQDPPVVVQTVAVEGFAAGVTAKDETAYVAACDSLTVVDLAKGEVVGKTWLDNAHVGQFLVAPAKDVEIDGSIAYVAAGRFGAVSIDVSKPEAPAVMGNCTVDAEMSFYASGVRSQNGKLFIAGGEWGVLPIDTAASGCTTLSDPLLPEYPDTEGEGKGEECSGEPPWQVVPWQDTWAPPAVGKDPIQTLPMGDVLYAFGDARRNALRAIDLKDSQDPALGNIGRYEEPRLATGIAASGNHLVVLGKGGGLFVRDEAQLLVPVLDAPALPVDTVAVGALADGRWVVSTAQNEIYVQGKLALSLGEPVWPAGLATSGNTVAVAYSKGVYLVDADSGEIVDRPSNEVAQLPSSLLWGKDGFVVGAPEWTFSVLLGSDGNKTSLPAHGFFSKEEIAQTSLWRRGVPSRLLLGAESGVVEIASLGGHTGLFVHASAGRLELPRGEYRGGAAIGKRAYLIAADRGAYRTNLVTVDVGAEVPTVLSVESFLGVGTGVAIDGDRLYVTDGDRGVRVYQRSDDATSLLGVVVTTEVAP